MNRIILSGMAIIMASFAMAQSSAVPAEFPGKSMRLAGAIQGYYAYPGRPGVSIDGKIMLRANPNHDVYNEFVITVKAAHTPATNGGNFFSAFDGKTYNNVSALMLLGGYRFNFGLPRYLSKDIDAYGGVFIELNAGGSYIHYMSAHKRTWAPAISPVFGYAVSRHLDLITSYTGAWPFDRKGRTILSYVSAGLQYAF